MAVSIALCTEAIGEDGLVKGGMKRFQVDTDAWIALTGTQIAQSKLYMLAQHPNAFPGKQLGDIIVIWHPKDGEIEARIDIDYEFSL